MYLHYTYDYKLFTKHCPLMSRGPSHTYLNISFSLYVPRRTLVGVSKMQLKTYYIGKPKMYT